MVSTEMPNRKGIQISSRLGRAVKKMRAISANAAALVATDMKPVIGVGAPWYTSGVQE